MATLTLTFFGSPIITLDNQAIHIGRRKAVALLAYLAVTQRHHNRAQLAALLWPEYDEAGARGELRRALSALNRALGAIWLDADRNNIAINSAADIQTDLLVFRQYITDARTENDNRIEALTAAVALVQDDFLAGFGMDDAPDFEEWQRFEAQAVQRDRIWALAQLARAVALYDPAQALTYGQAWLLLDPLDEAAHRQLMELYATAGAHSAAYQQYQECKRLLDQELGVFPADETTALYEQIRDGNVPTTPVNPTTPPSAIASTAGQGQSTAPQHLPPVPNHNLQAQLTPFVGRTHELQQLANLLAKPEQRLITVIGPGGIGKTRLSLQVAHDQVAAAANSITQWPDGIYFIELAALEAGAMLMSAFVEALGLSLQGSRPLLDQLVEYLQHKRMLIILDNLEQLLTAEHLPFVVDLFDELLLHVPAITLLVTSRERLNLHGETVFNLLGMPFPARVKPIGDTPDPVLTEYDAVRLFLQSARRADHAFQLTATNQGAVLQICQLVQGMPLALDLAAAWVRMLTCEEIATEIAQSIDFLTATAHNLPARHRSIAAVFHHSWQLLSTEEQVAFAKLSRFRGGCTRAAAQEVTGATLPLLTMLVDKSLLRRTNSGRFVMHELLRQFAAEALAQDPAQIDAVADRHCRYYMALLATCEAAFVTRERMAAWQRLQPELDNIRRAWDYAVQKHDFTALDQGLQSLYTLYIEVLNAYAEGIQRFEQTIAMAKVVVQATERTPDAGKFSIPATETVTAQQLVAHTQARLAMLHLFTGGVEVADQLFAETLAAMRLLNDVRGTAFVLSRYCLARLWQGALDEARALAEEGVQLYRELADDEGLQTALTHLGYVVQQFGEFALAQQLNLECLALLQGSGEPDRLITTLSNLGVNYLYMKEPEQALPPLEEALAISRAIANRSRIAAALANIMEVYVRLARFAEARVYGAEAITLFAELGQRQYVAVIECNLGHLELAAKASGDYEARAKARFYRSLTLAHAMDVDMLRVYGVTGLGELLAHNGQPERAVACLTLVADYASAEPDIKERAETILATLVAALSEEQYQQAQRQGRALSLSDVAAELLTVTFHFPAPSPQPRVSSQARPFCEGPGAAFLGWRKDH